MALIVAACAGAAYAGECIVDGGIEGFKSALNKVKDGGCVTDSATYRDRYDEYFPGTAEFQIIKWQSSDEISLTSDVAQIEASGDKPLVFIADSSTTVKFTGSIGGVVLKGSRIIIDHITIEGFSGSGIVMQGDRNLLIGSRVVSNGENGILVTGKDNRIVDSEIASNGINGILIGGGGAGQSCAGVSQSETGKGTQVAGCDIHDNGGSVSGEDCSDAEAQSIGTCRSLKLEAEQCFNLLKEEAPCDEPSVPMDDSCGHFWKSRDRCGDLWAKANVAEDASRDDAVGSVYNAYPGARGGSGIVVDARGVKIISKGRIHDNHSKGVYVNALPPAAICQDPSSRFDLNLIQTALVSETPVDDLFVSRFPLPSITQIAAIESDGSVSVTGSITISNEPWYPWNRQSIDVSALRAEVYVRAGGETNFVGSSSIDSGGRFLVRVNQSFTSPVFVAAIVDTEHGNTSPFATGGSASPGGDDDNDGLPNDQEDLNQNGQIDPGETDPINPDTDGDGLLDGEEKLHNGRVAAAVALKFTFAEINKLDPLNPDSDGDCLPDGFELGVSKEEAEALISRMPAKPHLTVPAQCQELLMDHTITILGNAVLYNSTTPATYANIAMLYDADPATISDPTSVDTDNDEMRDGDEDFNFSGKRDSIDNGNGDATWKETDPAIADSDGDGLPDGEEGDKDADGRIGPNESDPILEDTDGDGVGDGQEKRLGTYPNACDSDDDGLSDGVEVGATRPASTGGSCHGLEAAGTNYKNPHEMNPLNPDSDADGLMDGVEDANGNGWIEAEESDPSVADTDRDGLEDGVEAKGDFGRDGVPDFDLRLITAGPKCSPPPDISDVDCDGIPNAIDVDSDDDGCPDSQEGGWVDLNVNGVPDVYDNEAKGCGQGGGGGSFGGAGGGSGEASENASEEQGQVLPAPWWLTDDSGGGACSLVKDDQPKYYTTIILLLCVCLLVGFRRFLGALHKTLAGGGGGNETTHRRVFLIS